METERLLVYRPMYELLSLIDDMVVLFPKRMQRTIGDRMLTQAIDAMVALNEAHHSPDDVSRVRCQQIILSKVNAIRILVRLCNEKQILSVKQIEKLVRLTDSVGKQINAWKHKTEQQRGVSLNNARY